jgi:hypothetical protein
MTTSTPLLRKAIMRGAESRCSLFARWIDIAAGEQAAGNRSVRVLHEAVGATAWPRDRAPAPWPGWAGTLRPPRIHAASHLDDRGGGCRERCRAEARGRRTLIDGQRGPGSDCKAPSGASRAERLGRAPYHDGHGGDDRVRGLRRAGRSLDASLVHARVAEDPSTDRNGETPGAVDTGPDALFHPWCFPSDSPIWRRRK